MFGSELRDIHFKNSTFASGYTVEAYRVPLVEAPDNFEYNIIGKTAVGHSHFKCP